MNPQTSRVRPDLRDDLFTSLLHASAERHERPNLVETPHGLECEWALHERHVMTDAVNRWRARHGLPEVGIDEVYRVEQQAVGHVDYAAKFALYCAELAISEYQED